MARLNVQSFTSQMGRIGRATSADITDLTSGGHLGNIVQNAVDEALRASAERVTQSVINQLPQHNEPIFDNMRDTILGNIGMTMDEVRRNATQAEQAEARLRTSTLVDNNQFMPMSEEAALALIVGQRMRGGN